MSDEDFSTRVFHRSVENRGGGKVWIFSDTVLDFGEREERVVGGFFDCTYGIIFRQYLCLERRDIP